MRTFWVGALAALVLLAAAFSTHASRVRRHRIAIVAEIAGIAPRQVKPIWRTFPVIGYAFEIRTTSGERAGYIFLDRTESLHSISFLVEHAEVVPAREAVASGTESASRMVAKYWRVPSMRLRAVRLPPVVGDENRVTIQVTDAAGHRWIVQEYAGRLEKASRRDGTSDAGG